MKHADAAVTARGRDSERTGAPPGPYQVTIRFQSASASAVNSSWVPLFFST